MEPVTSDGGVKKIVDKPGDGGPVGPGARVTLRYELSLPEYAGRVFDSSSSRRDGTLSFRLGRRKALLGLEALAASMEVGERCTGRIQPAYAYGSTGLPRCRVPPDSVIGVDLEMVAAEPKEKAKGLVEMTPSERFEEAGKCKERGNAFFKEAKVEKAAAEYQRSLRFIEYVFYKRNKQTSETSDVTEHADADEGERASGSAHSEQSKKDAESATVEQNESESQPDRTDEHTPEDEEVIEVIDATAGPASDVEEERSSSKSHNSEGSQDGGGFVEATTGSSNDGDDAGNGKVESPDSEAEKNESSSDPSASDVRELHVVTLNNLALCLLKLGENKRAEELCSLSMTLDNSNHKPLFYRARARVAMGSWEEAKADLHAAAKLSPKNMGIRLELEKLKKKLDAHKVRERKAAAAMFG